MQNKSLVLPPQDASLAQLSNVVKNLQAYFVPTVIGLGMSGGILASVVYLKSVIKNTFFAQFLVAVSISNAGFLSTVILGWLFEHGFDVYAAPGLCQMVVFSSHFFPFLTFWSSILGAYLILWDTLKPKSLTWIHNASVSKTIVIGVALLSFTCYSYKSWTNGTRLIMGYSVCTVLPENENAMEFLNILDVLVLLILPSILFVLFDIVLIASRLYDAIRKIKKKKCRRNQEVLRIALSHSICYHVLATPRAISMMILIVERMSEKRYPDISDIMFHKIFQFVFYMYFAVLPVLPMFVSTRFRRGLFGMIGLRKRRSRTKFVRSTSIRQQTVL
ncbi:hypothetical protein SNE40_005764 [Patella caerulea]|uniref:G-protein coupled receptors family 1 profile domain-containing protein n=1 Tax=Patella caerulea TaxID=87958 RepID=A0AAN8K2F7_PATCE